MLLGILDSMLLLVGRINPGGDRLRQLLLAADWRSLALHRSIDPTSWVESSPAMEASSPSFSVGTP